MNRWVRRTVLLIVLGIVGVGALPAQAGGPTSVLLRAGDIGKVAAISYQDKAYSELEQLLNAESRDIPGEDSHEIGPSIQVSWLLHDIKAWRVDTIYPDAPGGPWIATTEGLNDQGQLPEKPVWHRATDDVQLVKFLVSLDLLHGTRKDGGPTTLPQPAPQIPPEAAAVDDTPTTALKIEEKPLLGWRWSIPGFLLGAAIAYLALRYLPRRNWQLIDEE
ncbi:hypothetical protein [Kribbella catacumbae]|uniref:hypothetical protein n=1 Tax=Kribbella catacumbae TaxID=460086 RepID=UPI00037F8BFE|nr:hypothetical protein [Kribbella catacumbae]